MYTFMRTIADGINQLINPKFILFFPPSQPLQSRATVTTNLIGPVVATLRTHTNKEEACKPIVFPRGCRPKRGQQDVSFRISYHH